MPAKLSVVTGDQPAVKPPRKLGRHGAQLWRTIMDEYEIADGAGLEMLASACSALDRAERCKERVDRDGEMIQGKGGHREHPLLKHENFWNCSNRSHPVLHEPLFFGTPE
jgi:hypothetical protein